MLTLLIKWLEGIIYSPLLCAYKKKGQNRHRALLTKLNSRKFALINKNSPKQKEKMDISHHQQSFNNTLYNATKASVEVAHPHWNFAPQWKLYYYCQVLKLMWGLCSTNVILLFWFMIKFWFCCHHNMITYDHQELFWLSSHFHVPLLSRFISKAVCPHLSRINYVHFTINNNNHYYYHTFFIEMATCTVLLGEGALLTKVKN